MGAMERQVEGRLGPHKLPTLLACECERPLKVCVTGGTGFVGAHVVARCLAAGHSVRATVRNTGSDLAKELLQLEGADDRLELVAANLLEEDGWADAVKDCELVFHVASVFTMNVTEASMVLDPALKGTQNVLTACANEPAVKTVVLTSSCAAVYDQPGERGKGVAFNESHWNETATEKSSPYSYAKTQAEKLAWKLAGEQSRYRLLVVNPPLILGPPLLSRADGASVEILQKMFSGMLSRSPKFNFGVVDVRDVAKVQQHGGHAHRREDLSSCGVETKLVTDTDRRRHEADGGRVSPDRGDRKSVV